MSINVLVLWRQQHVKEHEKIMQLQFFKAKGISNWICSQQEGLEEAEGLVLLYTHVQQ